MSEITESSGETVDAATTHGRGRPELPTVSIEAPIRSVVVHGRGAIVTRVGHLPEAIPSGRCQIAVEGVTRAARPGTTRCDVAGGRLRALRSRLVLPEKDGGSGPTSERVADLDRQIRAVDDALAVASRRRNAIARAEVDPLTGRSLREADATGRAATVLEVTRLADERIEHFDARMADFEERRLTLVREREVAALEDAQESNASREGPGKPTRTVLLEFDAAEGGARVELEYVVDAARWWPAYTLRVASETSTATLAIEAHVAQASGEDWSGVSIGLATSSIEADVQLPRLPSYRLGRVQPEPPRAFRPPPLGVEKLFMAYDEAMGRGDGGPSQPAQPAQPAPTRPIPTQAVPQAQMAMRETSARESYAALDSEESDGPETDEFPMLDAIAVSRSSAPKRKRSAMPAAPPPAEAAASFGGQAPGGGPLEKGGGGSSPSRAQAGGIKPEDWLDFERVEMAPVSSHRRGRLERRSREETRSHDLGRGAVAAQRLGAVDPFHSRGDYDHRYDATGFVNVPADGALHRVEVVSESCTSTLSCRANPRAESKVYREVTLDNPHASPLLAGPLDVYVEGSLVANTGIETVDRGGQLTVGLGVDERFGISRNARVNEESAGILGGKREIDHFIDIEIASSLGLDATVEVVDRMPVSRDDTVDVELFEESPKAERYDQVDRDAPVEGGLKWQIDVPAGGDASIRFGYRIKLRAKDEIVGGNRRE